MINWGGDPAAMGGMSSITGLDKSGFFPVYKSSQRTTCLEICGWGFNSAHSLELALQKYGLFGNVCFYGTFL